jgi:hypothetical protein
MDLLAFHSGLGRLTGYHLHHSIAILRHGPVCLCKQFHTVDLCTLKTRHPLSKQLKNTSHNFLSDRCFYKHIPMLPLQLVVFVDLIRTLRS